MRGLSSRRSESRAMAETTEAEKSVLHSRFPELTLWDQQKVAGWCGLSPMKGVDSGGFVATAVDRLDQK